MVTEQIPRMGGDSRPVGGQEQFNTKGHCWPCIAAVSHEMGGGKSGASQDEPQSEGDRAETGYSLTS
jgi:hypothetical protein